CSAVYASLCGYEVTILEMHSSAGGLATSWRRGDYTFETCLHWLWGSNPTRPMYARWREVFDIDELKFIHPAEFVRLQSERGGTLSIYTDLSQLHGELLHKAPEDAAEIRRFIAAIRQFARFDLPDFTAGLGTRVRQHLAALPHLAALQRWSQESCVRYGSRFKHPLLRAFFSDSAAAQ